MGFTIKGARLGIEFNNINENLPKNMLSMNNWSKDVDPIVKPLFKS